jgi:outer membrane receptor protein involved in Fe transport
MIAPHPAVPAFAVALCCASALAAPAAETTRRAYDLAPGDAAVTLKRFSSVSGQPIIYLLDKVRGVQTNAVRGEFTARDALDRMVAGTSLVVSHDAATGALTVSRSASAHPPAPRPGQATGTAPAPSASASSSEMKPAKTLPLARRALALLGAVFLPIASADAQNTGPTPKADEVVTLSPFTVTTEKDTGYAATNTLAGTRLATPVKDLGASISIYTKDFLADIGATTSNDLMIFATGMEAGGAGGNYSGVVGDINAGEVTAGAARTNAQLTRTRGLGGPNFSRNLFGSGIPLDSYIVETVTIIRGPNATLFGVGNPAGVVDSTLIKPDLRRDASKAEFRYGNNDSTRAVLDLNRVLIPGKLAARVATLYDDERYNQRPAFETKKRVFGALTFEPFRSTSIRGNFESGNSRSNRPITVPPFNSISKPWFDAGRPSNDFRFFDDPAINPNAANVSALANTGLLFVRDPVLQGMTMVYPNGNATAPNLSFRTVLLDLPVGTTNIADRPLGGVFDNNLNRDRAPDGWTWNPVGNISRLNAPFWTAANLAALPGGGRGQLPGFVPAGIKTQGFNDLSAFDFKNHQLDETGRQSDSFNVAHLALEQRAWRDRVGVQLEYFTQRRHTSVKDAFFQGGIDSHVFVDVNPTILGNLMPNPNYGRPFAYHRGGQLSSFGRTQNETLRATAYARYDFKDLSPKLGKWLGRHALSGLVDENSADSVNYGTRFGTAGPGTFSLPGNLFDPLRIGTATVYLGPSLIGNNNPIRLSPIQIPQLAAGAIPTPFISFQRDPTPTDTGRLVSLPIEWRELLQTGNLTREVIRSQAFALQSNWLDDHLVTIFGWRRDEDYFARRAIAYVPNPADPFDPGKVHYGLGDITFPGTPPFNVAKETKSYSYVARWPQKLVRLPLASDLSVFFNKSGNFTPQGGRVNQYAEALPSPEGTTKEYGFNLSFLNDRFSVRVNRFETRTIGAGSSPAAFGAAIQNISIASTAAWLLEANSNPGNAALIAQSRADAEKYFAALPSNYRSLYNFTISGTAPNLTSSFLQAIPGATDTVDFAAKGTEVDLVFNPTRRWRILANVAKQETVLSNAFPNTKEFIARMTPVWRELANRPAFAYPPGYVIGTPLPAGTQTLGDRVEQNVLIPFATSVATEGSASPEQRKWRANLVTNYSFGGDTRVFGLPLKGWNAGAGLRWQDKLGLGYPTTRQPDPGGNPARSGPVTIHIDRPYYAPAETNLDAWLGYTRRIWGDRIEWKAQLNVRNLWQSSGDLIGITVQPWGEIATTRLAPERRWYLTNTFSF